MQKLFSPWRSEYIESFQAENSGECIFCSAAKEDPEDENSLLLHKAQFTFILMNRYPYNNGHLLIQPYRHVANLSDLNDDERLEIFHLIEKSLTVLETAIHAQGFNLGSNIGKVAGAGVEDHIHFHVVPRWNGDTNFMPTLADIKLISEEMRKTKSKLIKHFRV